VAIDLWNAFGCCSVFADKSSPSRSNQPLQAAGSSGIKPAGVAKRRIDHRKLDGNR
jgi:hypothetical protein